MAKSRIVVIGLGGGGLVAIEGMAHSRMTGVELAAADTDAAALQRSSAFLKLQLGANLVKGLGAGGNPAIGAKAAQESAAEIERGLSGATSVVIVAGMGGGTGGGAAPEVARIAKRLGAQVVGIVTKPFSFEGPKRRTVAEETIAQLQGAAGALIVISNDTLTDKLSGIDKSTTAVAAFKVVDEALRQAVKAVVDRHASG
ncbi:MAG: hypothetical protein HY329_12870 [Chloroflexi bacterium]|nr:hypothetical protein [Chloroflexota bacterium]